MGESELSFTNADKKNFGLLIKKKNIHIVIYFPFFEIFYLFE